MNPHQDKGPNRANETVWMAPGSQPAPARARPPRNWTPFLVASGFAVILLTLAAVLRGEAGLKTPWILALVLAAGIETGLALLVGRQSARSASLLKSKLSSVHERSVKLRLSKEDLEEINRIKNDFFNNVSHEFRTPITLTLGPIQGVLAGRYGSIPEEVKKQLKLMAAQQDRLLALINQILEAAKLEAGLTRLKAAPVSNFNTYISSRAEQFRPLSEERHLTLVVTLDPRLVGQEVYLDREKFDKVIFNLLSNAHKFTSRGSIEVATALREKTAVVSVRDSGIGIRQDQLAQVFDRFRQAEGSEAKGFAGSGLGLALVREYARLHGGEAAVTSEYGKGTTFEVTVPLGKTHLDPKSIVAASEPEAEVNTPPPPSNLTETVSHPVALEDVIALNAETDALFDPARPTVLYADDQAELRSYVRDLLKGSYNVFVAANGREGVEAARRVKPDLILSDLMMPEMSGTEFCKKVREDPELRVLPFVLLTAKAEAESKIAGLEKGADDYLAKPFSEEELIARVRNLVTLRQQQTRLKRELQAARAIQQSLLPPPYRHPSGTFVDYLYHPSEDLSGDFCEIIPCGDWTYFYVADVTSHGTASAQVTYLLKEIFRNTIGTSAAPLLTDLMRIVLEKYAAYHLEYDVGIQVGRFHDGQRQFEYLRGNAPSPLRVGRTGTSNVLTIRPGPVLSKAVSEASYTLLQTTLDPKDRVYLFTDGCYEFSSDFGHKKFLEVLSSIPSEDWTKSIFEALVKTNNGSSNFPDDVTILRLEVS